MSTNINETLRTLIERLHALSEQYLTEAKRRPGGQQTREKSKREIYEQFAYELKELEAALTTLPQPTEQPTDRSGRHRLLLNEYGRACYRAGQESAALSPAPPQAQERMFPIQGGPHIPWSVIVACESQMKANHDQSAETLARRGGLSPAEAVDVLLGRSCNSCQLSNEQAITKMLQTVQERQRLAASPPAQKD